MKGYQIYLCGGMAKFGEKDFAESNKWRKYCKDRINYESKLPIEVINPNNYFNFVDNPPQYASQDEVMHFDLYKLRNSDLVIANFNDPHSLGSMAEISIAYERRIPIIGLNECGYQLHPWQKCMCERIFDNIDAMLDYIRDFYVTRG